MARLLDYLVCFHGQTIIIGQKTFTKKAVEALPAKLLSESRENLARTDDGTVATFLVISDTWTTGPHCQRDHSFLKA